jgi:hypothetical protein
MPNRFGEKSPNWKGGKPNCVECGKKLSKRGYKRCKNCRNIPFIGKIPANFKLGKKGHLNFNWKGGVSSQDKLERLKFIHHTRKKVFERDNYTCQMCGARGGILQVDHIQEWSKYIEGRFDINNCRTLCDKCHYKITFGKEMSNEVKTWGQNFKYFERRVD